MIVNYTESGWKIILQRNHGLLAAEICAYWRKSDQPERWLETLIATAEHDDVYNELQQDDLLNAQGGPLNYKMTFFREDYCRGLIERAVTKSQYVALLVAAHIHFVHGAAPEAKAFCRQLRRQESRWRKQTGVTAREVAASYRILECCDAFSLLICQELIPPEQRSIQISTGPGGVAYSCKAKENGDLTVTPWPFEVPAFEIHYEFRLLKALEYTSLESFRRALAQAPVQRHGIRLTSV